MITLEKEYIDRRVYISTVGWVSAILSGLIIYFTIWGMVTLLLMRHEMIVTSISPEGLFNAIHAGIYVVYMLFTAYGIMLLVSSIGVIHFRDWGRNWFIFSSWTIIVISLAILLLYVFQSGKIIISLIGKEGNPFVTSGFETMLRVRIASYGILLVAIVRTLYRVVLRFGKREYKEMFG